MIDNQKNKIKFLHLCKHSNFFLGNYNIYCTFAEMNIFVLHQNPSICASYHCDKHIVKMILETAQMLCTCHWLNGNEAPYKPTHVNHPCSIWVRDSLDNYIWLSELGIELCQQYTLRYGKKHKTQSVLEWCLLNQPKIDSKGITPWALAMPDIYKQKSVVSSYRSYYINEKKYFANWKNGKPKWFK